MTKKLFVKTHGCQMNEYDSAKMIDLLKAEEDFELLQSALYLSMDFLDFLSNFSENLIIK